MKRALAQTSKVAIGCRLAMARLVTGMATATDLRGLVDVFRRQAGVAWTPEEIEDVVEYLNRTRYHFLRR
jgi:hypothetical protein